MKSYGISILLAACAALVVAGSGCRGAAVDPDEALAVRIGLLVAVDEGGQVRESNVNAARLAVEHVNQSGGLVLDGRPRRVELHVMPAPDAKEALAGAIELVHRRRVLALVGPYASAPALPVATLADASGVPMIVPAETVTGPTQGRRFVFRTTPRDAEQGLQLARYVMEEVPDRRVAVVFDPASAGSEALAKSFRVGTTGFPGKIEGVELGDDTVSRLGEARPDTVVLLLEPDAGAKLVRDARRAGIDVEMIGIDLGNTFSFAFSGLDRTRVAVAWHPLVPTEASRAFVQAFVDHHATTPGTNDALTYDAVVLLIEAMRGAGTGEPDAVQRSLRGLQDHQGVTGVFSYGGSSAPTKALAVVEVRDGEVSFRQWLTPFGS